MSTARSPSSPLLTLLHRDTYTWACALSPCRCGVAGRMCRLHRSRNAGLRYTHKPRRRTHLQECFAHTGTYPPASSRHLVSNMHGTVDRMWVGKARRGSQWCSHRPTLHRSAGNEYRTTQRAQMAMYSAPLRSHPDSFPNTYAHKHALLQIVHRCRKRRAPIWHVAPGQPQPERCPNKLKHKR